MAGGAAAVPAKLPSSPQALALIRGAVLAGCRLRGGAFREEPQRGGRLAEQLCRRVGPGVRVCCSRPRSRRRRRPLARAPTTRRHVCVPTPDQRVVDTLGHPTGQCMIGCMQGVPTLLPPPPAAQATPCRSGSGISRSPALTGQTPRATPSEEPPAAAARPPKQAAPLRPHLMAPPPWLPRQRHAPPNQLPRAAPCWPIILILTI